MPASLSRWALVYAVALICGTLQIRLELREMRRRRWWADDDERGGGRKQS
jgi:hypothetical protein